MLDKKIEAILEAVQKPARYMGEEWNAVRKDWGAVKLRFLISYPDLYEVGMSYLGLKVLYGILNERPDVVCERVFAPWTDMEGILRSERLHLFSLESKKPVNTFDVIGFSLGYELTYTNVLNILDLGGVPQMSGERADSDPLVIAGGPCCFNPEPMADIFDAFLIGDGEEAVGEIVEACERFTARTQDHPRWTDRRALLAALGEIGGVYVPSLYDVSYGPDGTVRSFVKKSDGLPARIAKRVIMDLDSARYPCDQIVPYIQVIHDRISIEVMRGCKNACKFCQAGSIYRPPRERSKERIIEIARDAYRRTGHEEISLVSLSSGDHSRIREVITALNDEFRGKAVSVSFPSLRIEDIAGELPQLIVGVKKTGLTFAPEAGSERLRSSINKNIDIADLLSAVKKAYEVGWQRIKLYFMIGLPTEEDRDIEGIVSMIEDVSLLRKQVAGAPALVTASVSAFIPKPHTFFQREAMSSLADLGRKRSLLISAARKRRLKVKLDVHDFRKSFIEGVFSRGDRNLGKSVYRAWQKGSRFDGWQEHFRFETWIASFQETGVVPEFYVYRTRDAAEKLPWDFIDL